MTTPVQSTQIVPATEPRAPLAEVGVRPPPPSDLMPASESRSATDAHSLARFRGAGTLIVSDEERAILAEPLSPEEVTTDPPGEYQRRDAAGEPMMYLSHAHARMRLLRAFGPGGVTLVPVGPPSIRRLSDRQAVVMQGWDLLVRGCFAGRAIGECAYNPTNPRMTEGDAIEGAKSNALTRICKDFGLGLELFTRQGRERLRPGGKPPTSSPSPASASTPVPAHDGKPEALSETLIATGKIEKITQKVGGTKEKPWTRYTVIVADGTAYNTFDRAHADAAKAAKESGQEVAITYMINAHGNKIEGLSAVVSAEVGESDLGGEAGTDN